MFLYESHLGGIYTTDDEQDFDDLHCEECGDSDFEIGQFEDCEEDIERVWQLLKPSDLCCIGCDEPFEKCQKCKLISEDEDASSYGNYSLPYVMNFLDNNFTCAPKTFVTLICKDADSGMIYSNVKPKGCEFGTAHELPSCFCYRQELADKIAYSLIPCQIEETLPITASDMRYMGKDVDKRTKAPHLIYECDIHLPQEKLNHVFYIGEYGGWGGWNKSENLKLIESQNFLREYLLTEEAETVWVEK